MIMQPVASSTMHFKTSTSLLNVIHVHVRTNKHLISNSFIRLVYYIVLCIFFLLQDAAARIEIYSDRSKDAHMSSESNNFFLGFITQGNSRYRDCRNQHLLDYYGNTIVVFVFKILCSTRKKVVGSVVCITVTLFPSCCTFFNTQVVS